MDADLNTVVAVTFTIAFLWRVWVLVGNGPTSGRVASAALFGAYALGNGTDVPAVVHLIGSSARIVDNLALLVANVMFIYFFSVELDKTSRGVTHPAVYSTLGALAGATLVAAWAVNPHGLPEYEQIGAAPSLQSFLFYVPVSVFDIYALLVSAWLAAAAASRKETVHRWPFRICALAFLLQLIGGPLTRVPSVVLRFSFGVQTPGALEAVALWILTVGLVGLAVGLGLIAIVSVVSAHRHHRRLRREFTDLTVLWARLSRQFPSIVLRPMTPLSTRAALLLYPEYTYERRCTECRDGLWLLSPWVSDAVSGPRTGASLSIEQQAGAVDDGLRRAARGDEPIGPPVALAAPPALPAGSRFDAARGDAARLVALSRALRAGRYPAVASRADRNTRWS